MGKGSNVLPDTGNNHRANQDMIDRGSRIPSVKTKLITADDTATTTSDAVLGSGLVVFFAVPGAFTPTCHVNHLPGFVANASKLRAAGVDRIVCASVNDAHVMKAWAEASDALGKIDFLADGNAELADAMGLCKDMSESGMGKRFTRFAAVVRNGVVQHVFLEDAPGVAATGAPAILMALETVQA
ncbi:MAG: peroxiredoxin [Devosia sp.]|nr:peroxiredoxin [Devosia sp.]